MSCNCVTKPVYNTAARVGRLAPVIMWTAVVVLALMTLLGVPTFLRVVVMLTVLVLGFFAATLLVRRWRRYFIQRGDDDLAKVSSLAQRAAELAARWDRPLRDRAVWEAAAAEYLDVRLDLRGSTKDLSVLRVETQLRSGRYFVFLVRVPDTRSSTGVQVERSCAHVAAQVVEAANAAHARALHDTRVCGAPTARAVGAGATCVGGVELTVREVPSRATS